MKPTLYRTLWRLKHWRDHDLLDMLRRVEENQWLSRDELAAMSWEKQKRLVAHAYANSTFYRQKYDEAGFQPSDLKQPDDFSRLPLLTKDEVRNHIGEMMASGTPPSMVRQKFTGGSTGVPLMVYHDTTTDSPLWAVYMRTVGRWGIRMGDRTAHIWGLNRLNEEYLYDKQSWWHRALKNYVLLDAFEMSQAKMEGFASLLSRFRPDLLIGYASAVTAFAEHLEAAGGAGFQPHAIWLTSEITLDFQKETVERVFHSPVYDQYGSVEVYHCAVECEHREGLHLDADFRVIEIVDEAGQPLPTGETGQVVVTDLLNFAAPLIRYRNEDMGSLIDRTCPCGRGLPLMDKVTGRIYDMFILPDGSQVYSHRFTTFFYDHVDQVKAFQVHQTKEDRAVVRLVPTESCVREELSAELLQKFRGYTKGQVQFDIQFVESIPKEVSGKYRFTKSDVLVKPR